ncbi:hypothetical protein BGZ79_002049 [Entomortierella chlamydospora]|nr:hypothetical protein BGZ79_002049 [Entomortierella chlamydospora]
MPIALWAFDIRQELLLENIKPLVTPLIDGNRPNIVPITNLLSFLPKIECDRLLQFRFEDDMRRALIGRLMIHAFFVAHHGCRWDELVFSRSATNKPILAEPNHLRGISFNISHHGNWVILAGNTSLENTVRLGIDVMDFQEQFTAKEASFLRDAPSDPNAPDSHLRRFYRLWCLKEAIVKALGVGIDFDLTSFEFTINETVETLEVRQTL